jgi:hypothetical protein
LKDQTASLRLNNHTDILSLPTSLHVRHEKD